jgi:hypothetical protein
MQSTNYRSNPLDSGVQEPDRRVGFQLHGKRSVTPTTMAFAVLRAERKVWNALVTLQLMRLVHS